VAQVFIKASVADITTAAVLQHINICSNVEIHIAVSVRSLLCSVFRSMFSSQKHCAVLAFVVFFVSYLF